MQPYPMIIIAFLFFDVKNGVPLHELFQIFIANSIKCHNRIFKIRVICIQDQTDNDIQICVRELLYSKYRACVL